jgi:hypothetical protein
MHPSRYSFIWPSIHPSDHPSIWPSIHPSIHPKKCNNATLVGLFLANFFKWKQTRWLENE